MCFQLFFLFSFPAVTYGKLGPSSFPFLSFGQWKEETRPNRAPPRRNEEKERRKVKRKSYELLFCLRLFSSGEMRGRRRHKGRKLAPPTCVCEFCFFLFFFTFVSAESKYGSFIALSFCPQRRAAGRIEM